jgi:hypothetical protein
MKALSYTWRYVIIIGGFVVLVSLVIDFNNRMAELRRLTTEKERVSARVTELVETQYALETQVAYATSEAAVYKWAYESRRMVRPGDKLVVPIQPPGSTPAPTPTAVVTPEVITNWQVWLSLFIDLPAERVASAPLP